ncbi:MAG: hypothetical protein ACRD1R_17055, partial [Acidobacteriota bacterium]
MSMSEEDRHRRNFWQFALPIFSAIDHDALALVADQQRGVPRVQGRPLVDVPTRSQEGQFHGFASMVVWFGHNPGAAPSRSRLSE